MLRLHVYAQAAPVANEEAFLTSTVRNLSVDQHCRNRQKTLPPPRLVIQMSGCTHALAMQPSCPQLPGISLWINRVLQQFMKRCQAVALTVAFLIDSRSLEPRAG